MTHCSPVIPAKAGIQGEEGWVPVVTGTTKVGVVVRPPSVCYTGAALLGCARFAGRTELDSKGFRMGIPAARRLGPWRKERPVKWIDYARPESLDEAVKLLADGGGKARPLAGGTDLIVLLRTNAERVGSPDLVVDVKGIPELNELSYNDDDGLTLGAAVECYKVYSCETIACKYPGLTDAATLIGGIQIQGRASIGGNLCNATPSGDSIPALIALGATANVTGPNGSRQVAVEDFCTGPSRTVLGSDELLVSISIPAPKAGSGARYIRFIPRNEMDIAVAGAGVSVEIEDGTFTSARVALASVAPTPLFVQEAGDSLAGKPVNDESIAEAASIASAAAKPITDMRGTAEYRTHLCEVLTRRALNTAVERAKGGE